MATAALRRAMNAFTRPPDPTDAALLRQFADGRSEAAFAALVRRHGPLVLGVCRRMVQDRHLAEDAFQAAFVVLARRASGIDPARPLGPWLYGVAHRVALRARTMIGRRRKRETLAAGVPEVPHTPPVVDDTTAILDEEIARLPDATREAVILCELQGLSRREAAKRLGIAEGTLSSRLAAARKMLAAKLRSRGVVLSVALAGAAVLSPALASAAVAAATGASLSSVVVSLADGASAMTLLNKLKLTGVALLFLLLSAGGVGPWGANNTSAAPVPKPKPDGELLWVLNDITYELKAYSPEGKLVKEFKLPEGKHFLGLTPDGQKIAFAGKKGKIADPKEKDGLTVHLRDIGADTVGTDTGLEYREGDLFTWSPDATRVVHSRTLNRLNPFAECTYTLHDLGTRQSTELKLPYGHHVRQWASDGTWLLLSSAPSPPICWTQWSKFTLSDGTVTPIATDFPSCSVDVSPDAKSLIGYAYRVVRDAGEIRNDRKLVRVDVATGAETTLSEFTEPTGYEYGWIYWSPDGKRLAFWCDAQNTADDSWNMQLSVCDADTGERKTILTLPNSHWVLQGWYPAAEKIKAPVPKEKDHGLVWFHDRKAGELVGYTPGGREGERRKLPAGQTFVGVTPDGQQILYSAMAKGSVLPTYHLRPFNGDGDAAGTNLEVTHYPQDRFEGWTPDGKKFLRGRYEDPRKIIGVRAQEVEYDVVDVAAKTSTPVKTPDETHILGWAPDGERFIGTSVGIGPGKFGNLYVFASGEKPTPIRSNDGVSPLALTSSSDGKTQFAGGWKRGPHDTVHHAVYRFDPAADEPFTELLHEEGLCLPYAVPSPDGTRLAAAWRYAKKQGEEDELRLTVAKADGTGRTTITLRDKAKGDDLKSLHLLGWFKIKAPVPKEKADGGLIWTHTVSTNTLTMYTPAGEKVKTVKLADGCRFDGLTPDGAKMTFAGKKGEVPAKDDTSGLTLHIGEISEKGEGTDTGLGWEANDQFIFSPDGKRVVRVRQEKVGQVPPGGKVTPPEFSHTLYDLGTKKETPVELPSGHQLIQWSADGKTWRVLHNNLGADPTLPSYRWLTTPADGKPDLKPICDTASLNWLEPDAQGKTFLGAGAEHPPTGNGLECLLRVDGGKAEVLVRFAGVAFINLRRSPDGKRVVCVKYEFNPQNQAANDTALVLFDADGKNEEKLLTVPNDGQNTHLLGWFPTKPAAKPDDPKAKPPVREPIKAPVPKAKVGEELLISSRNGSAPFLVVSPDGKSKEVLPVPAGVEPAMVRVSPDGRWAAYGEPLTKNVKHAQGYWPNRVRVIDLRSPDAEPRTLMDEAYGEALTWSADGKSLFVSRFDPNQLAAITAQKNGLIPMTTTRVNLADGKETSVELPEGHRALAVSPDGQTWLTHTIDTNRTTNEAFIVTTKDGNVDQKTQVGKHQLATQFSFDGKRALCGTGSIEPGQFQLASVEIATAQMTEIKLPDGVNKNWIGFGRWSADGSRMAFAWSEPTRDRKGNNVEAYRVTVCDADGSNPVTVAELEPGANIRGIDWMPARPKKDDPKARSPAKEPINAPVPKEKAEDGLIWIRAGRENKLTAYTPDGKEARTVELPDGVKFSSLTPDGKQMLFGKGKDVKAMTLHVSPVGNTDEGTDTGLGWKFSDHFVLSPDGKAVVRVRLDKPVLGQGRKGGEPAYSHVLYDFAAKKETKLDLPTDHRLMRWSADGKTWLVRQYNFSDDALPVDRWLTTPTDGKIDLKPICDTHSFDSLDPNPDGKGYLGVGWKHSPKAITPHAVLAVADGKAVEVAQIEWPGTFTQARWSPDGKRIACMKYGTVKDDGQKKRVVEESVLSVTSTDGKTEEKLLTWPDKEPSRQLLGWFPTDPKATLPKKE